jgi:GNAT superfamily N-acetyltransferase
MSDCEIRRAVPDDAELVLSFIRELAEYEKLLPEVAATAAALRGTLFCEAPRAFCDIAWVSGAPAGFAVWFFNYSTFLAKHGLYVEDLYVRPQYRGTGIGKALLAHLASVALIEGCGRMEWWVLDWNAPAVGFYKALGAEQMKDWTVFRLTGDALKRLATS